MFKLHAALAATLAFAAAAMPPATHATESYPSKPIRMIVGFPPGTATDLVARLIAERLSQANKWVVIVENKVGQSGSMAAYEVSQAKPDGYTLLLSANGPLSTNPNLYTNVRYVTTRDFTPITKVAVLPYVLVVNAASPYRTVGDVVKAAQAEPGRLNYASPGNGSTSHLISATFATQTHTKYVHIPYKGSAESLTGMLSSNIDLMFDTSLVTVPQVRAGKLRPLAVTTSQRISSLPDVPTLQEAGLSNFDMAAWLGVVGPPGIPREITGKLNTEIGRALNEPALKDKLTKLGADVSTNTPEQFGEFLKVELKKWGEAVSQSGAKVQ